jgi:hypothetical protein
MGSGTTSRRPHGKWSTGREPNISKKHCITLPFTGENMGKYGEKNKPLDLT